MTGRLSSGGRAASGDRSEPARPPENNRPVIAAFGTVSPKAKARSPPAAIPRACSATSTASVMLTAW